MKRILIVTDAWTPQRNGVVKATERITAELTARGYVVELIHPGLFRTMPMPSYPEIRLALSPQYKVKRIIERFKPEAVHLMTEAPLGWAVRNYCVRHHIPFTTWYHTHLHLFSAARFAPLLRPVQSLMKQFHAKSSRILVTTESLKRDLEAQGYARVSVIPFGIETDVFTPMPVDDAPWPKPVFVYFGRLAVEKNVEAFLGLDLPGTKVVIGSEPEARFAELKARYPSVCFLGAYDALTPASATRLAKQLSQCDVYVYPSKTDTFGLVVLEALACGLPVAAYDVQGPRDILTHGKDGYLGTDLREASLKCLDLSRKECRATALRYSWERCTDAFLNHLHPIPSALLTRG